MACLGAFCVGNGDGMSGRSQAYPLFHFGEPTRTPLVPALGEYFEFAKSTKTKAGYTVDRWYLRRSFGIDGTETPLRVSAVEDLTAVILGAFFLNLVHIKGYQPKTYNRFREQLHRFVNWCIRYKGTRFPDGFNPVANIERRREHAPIIRHLRRDDISTQLGVLDSHPELQTMAAVMIYAGLRRGEALWLTRKDVDLGAGLRGMVRVQAKKIDGEFWEPKTKVNRGVPVSTSLRPYLERWEAVADTGRVWYFPAPKGGRWDGDNFAADLRKLNRAAGLDWGCLDYRHTFGSLLASKGESLYKISALMGNSPEICRRHYAALMPECLVDSVEFG